MIENCIETSHDITRGSMYYVRSRNFEKIKILSNKIRFLPVNSTTLRKKLQHRGIRRFRGGVATPLEFNYRFRPSSWNEFFQQKPLLATFYQFHGSEEPGRYWSRELVTRSWKISVSNVPKREGRRLDEPKILFTSFNMPFARVICYQIAIDRPFPFLSFPFRCALEPAIYHLFSELARSEPV